MDNRAEASPDEVRARLKRYHVTRDARVLWPDVPPRAFECAVAEIARVSAAVLAEAQTTARLEQPCGLPPTALGVAGFASGMGPLLGYWIETGRITADPAIAGLFATHLDHGRKRAARLRRELEALLPEFGRHGIEVAVLKGMHTAYRYFPEPGTRPAADIDLLVRPDDCGRARDLLRGLGFVESEAKDLPLRSHWALPPPPGEEAEVRSLVLTHAENPWALDLHATLDRAFVPGSPVGFGPFDLSTGDVWSEFARPPRPARVLPQPLLLAYIGLHASEQFPALPLMRLVELVLIVRRDFGSDEASWTRFQDLVTGAGTERFLYPALELAEQFVPGTLPTHVRRWLAAAAPARLRRALGRVTPASAQRLFPAPQSPGTLWAASLRERLAVLAHLVWPRNPGGRIPLREFLPRQRLRFVRLVRAILGRGDR